jgi:hypothetical protein
MNPLCIKSQLGYRYVGNKVAKAKQCQLKIIAYAYCDLYPNTITLRPSEQ